MDVRILSSFTWISIQISVRVPVSHYPYYEQLDQEIKIIMEFPKGLEHSTGIKKG